jgi:hypothetical protein
MLPRDSLATALVEAFAASLHALSAEDARLVALLLAIHSPAIRRSLVSPGSVHYINHLVEGRIASALLAAICFVDGQSSAPVEEIVDLIRAHEISPLASTLSGALQRQNITFDYVDLGVWAPRQEEIHDEVD